LEQNAKHTVLLEEADEETIGLRVKARETLDALKVWKMPKWTGYVADWTDRLQTLGKKPPRERNSSF